MSEQFASVLRGLMENRRLSPKAVSRASTRAESTIQQLLYGKISPTVDILEDIAPVLQMPIDDLLVIAGVSAEPAPDRPKTSAAAAEIGRLVAAASFLTPEQVGHLVDIALSLKTENRQ